MKQKFLIGFALVFLVALLVLLNAATYVQREKVPDTEFAPNRSTYNSGSTGTQAFYSLLSETGRNVTRWQSSLETIASETRNRPSVLVMIGPLRNGLTDVENTELMRWVSTGGTLLLIDREPSDELVKTTSQWQMSVRGVANPDLLTVDASDAKQMTASTPALKPGLPSQFARRVDAVQPSRFASSITLERFAEEYPRSGEPGTPRSPTATPDDFYGSDSEAAPSPDNTAGGSDLEDEEIDRMDATADAPVFAAPLIHVSGSGRNVLVEAPFGMGRVIVLSDPYIVSNGGIGAVDNAQLAINLVTSSGGQIAFDEYHHGYGANTNRVFQYFEGTPVIAIFLQFGLMAALVFLSQSLRFARPVPERQASRLSKLEYVSAMAELQQRTRAYDLAIENIYADFRRRVCGLVGLDNTMATRSEIAARVAERIGGNPLEIQELLYQCEDVIRGEPIGRRETVELVERLRRLEAQLGLKRSSRGT